MNQRQLMAFRATMMLGSVTAAARHLGVSQPAVSRLIGELEASLGFALFLRQAARLTPTREAQQFYAEVDAMFSGLDRLQRVADEIRSMARAAVRFATLPVLSLDVIPAAAKSYITRFPGAQLMQDVHSSARVLEMVASRQVEFGFAQSFTRRDDVAILRSWHLRTVCVMPADHPLAGCSSLTPRQLDGVPLVMLSRQKISISPVLNAFAVEGIAPNIVAESQPSYAAGQLAAAGCGVAIIDELTAQALGRQVRMVPFEPEVTLAVHLMAPQQGGLSRAAENFLSEICAVLDDSLQLQRQAA